MADEPATGGEQLVTEQENTEQVDQLDDQVEDAEKQVETTTEPSAGQDGETAEANVNDPNKVEDTSETKDTEEAASPTDKEESSTPSFPNTLEGFGYKFNENGQLRQIENNEPFLYDVKDGDKEYNEAHYRALGEVITEHVYQLMESDAGLIRTDIPVDVKPDEAHSFIFESANARKADKLMVIIHGSGAVRAGQWSRRLIINKSLESGTQLPYIKRSLENSYGVLVLNTNRNIDMVNGKALPVRGNDSSEAHIEYVWDHVISKCAAKRIDVVAHSRGGMDTLYLVVERFDEVKNKVEKIAFTDSVHSMPGHCRGQEGLTLERQQDIIQWFSKHAINWVSSKQPLDTVIAYAGDDAAQLSAGTDVHEETSWCSIESIFKYFTGEKDYMQLVTKPEEPKDKSEEPVTKTEDEPEEPITKTEGEPEEPVTKTEDAKTEELVTKTEDEPEEPITKTEGEPEEPVTKTEGEPEEPVTKTEDEPEEPVTKTEDEPGAKTEELVTKTEDEPEEPIAKTEGEPEEPVTKTEGEPEEPVTKTEDEPEEPVTKTEDEPGAKTEELVTKTEDEPEEPITKTEGEPEEPVTKTEDEPEEPVTKTEDEPEEPVTKTEDEPVTKTEEEPVTKSEEPVTKSEEPVSKYQESDKDIDKRVDESGHHQSGKKFTESHPSDDMEPTSCCIVL